MHTVYLRLLLLGFCILAHALDLTKKDNPAVLSVPLERRSLQPSEFRERVRRQSALKRSPASTFQVPLENEVTLYYASASFGNPPQEFKLHIDTGSSDTWVYSQSSDCNDISRRCAQFGGAYNAAESNTYRLVNRDFNITYADGSTITGDYVSDSFMIAGVEIGRLQFGLGNALTVQQPILGLGYVANEAIERDRYGYAIDNLYPNVPKALQSQGYINANAYSLWLNNVNASMGSLLFGGVDTEKFHGVLHTMPIVPTSGAYRQFVITLTSIGTNGQAANIANNLALAVLLDSGTSLTYLPRDIVNSLAVEFNVQFDEQYSTTYGGGVIDCSWAERSVSVDFTFTTPRISIPIRDLVQIGDYDSQGNPVCVFGIAPAFDELAVLGDAFLRSAYVVFDMTNNEISIAQTRFNATSQNILEITENRIPHATPVQDVAVPTDSAFVQSYYPPSGSYTGFRDQATNAAPAGASATGRLWVAPQAAVAIAGAIVAEML